METIENIKANHYHLGKKIERVRRLRGMTQTELGQLLGITKQAVSKMEQTEKIDDERLEKIASALGVTTDGLKEYNEETVLYNTNNFYENCGVKNAIGNNQTFNNFPIEQTIELFEKLLEKQKEHNAVQRTFVERIEAETERKPFTIFYLTNLGVMTEFIAAFHKFFSLQGELLLFA